MNFEVEACYQQVNENLLCNSNSKVLITLHSFKTEAQYEAQLQLNKKLSTRLRVL